MHMFLSGLIFYFSLFTLFIYKLQLNFILSQMWISYWKNWITSGAAHTESTAICFLKIYFKYAFLYWLICITHIQYIENSKYLHIDFKIAYCGRFRNPQRGKKRIQLQQPLILWCFFFLLSFKIGNFIGKITFTWFIHGNILLNRYFLLFLLNALSKKHTFTGSLDFHCCCDYICDKENHLDAWFTKLWFSNTKVTEDETNMMMSYLLFELELELVLKRQVKLNLH